MVDPDALVSGPDAAAYLTEHTPHRITGDMVRKWAHRGYRDLAGQRRKLIAVDHLGERGAARYRWSDLLDAERATRRNPKTPGRGRVLLSSAA
ncbi:hypothetical protein [Glycomyces sp. NPDC021274]|uniref:hypothetical protein n=1 Tax=Glycomyces sp. NPDC021274 TaxID=3155120 RepID=UPI0033FA93B9